MLGIGGTLREPSRSLAALEHAAGAAASVGARAEVLDLMELDLPLFRPGRPLRAYPEGARRLIETVAYADGLLWSTAGCHGTLAGRISTAGRSG